MYVVNIRQLVASLVHLPIVGVALQYQFSGPGFPFLDLPGGHHRALDIVVKGLLLEEGVVCQVLVIFGVELFQVMAGCKETEALKAQGPLVAVEGQAHCLGHAVGGVKFELDGVVVHLLQFHRLAVDDPLGVGGRGDVFVEFDVLPPEDDIIRRKRMAIGPLEALAKIEGQGLALVGPLPIFSQARLNRIGRVTWPAQHRFIIDASPGMEILNPGEGPVPGATILAN